MTKDIFKIWSERMEARNIKNRQPYQGIKSILLKRCPGCGGWEFIEVEFMEEEVGSPATETGVLIRPEIAHWEVNCCGRVAAGGTMLEAINNWNERETVYYGESDDYDEYGLTEYD